MADVSAVKGSDDFRQAEYLKTLAQNSTGAAWTLLLYSDTLLAAGGSAVSGWIDLQTAGVTAIRPTRTSTGGTYALEIDWSRDGVTADITETVTVGNNVSVEKKAPMRYARVRARNTDAVAAFTVHRTVVHGT